MIFFPEFVEDIVIIKEIYQYDFEDAINKKIKEGYLFNGEFQTVLDNHHRIVFICSMVKLNDEGIRFYQNKKPKLYLNKD